MLFMRPQTPFDFLIGAGGVVLQAAPLPKVESA
jgi:hypothetical protein